MLYPFLNSGPTYAAPLLRRLRLEVGPGLRELLRHHITQVHQIIQTLLQAIECAHTICTTLSTLSTFHAASDKDIPNV